MNKWTKKLTALGLCAALSLTFVTGAAAQANSKALSLRSTQAAQTAQTGAYKDETVYILADADGTVQNVIVSDWLQNPSGSSRLSDRSDLTDIENVKGDESFTENGSEKVWDAQGKDVYYQGSSDQALPVGLTVSYKLDGKDISAGELAGKSGRVTIRFDYENRQYELRKINGKQEKIYVPFAMLTGLLLDSDSFRNVEVVNGKLLNDGDHMIVAGLAFPGMQENLALEKDKLDIPDYVEITADAENFELGMTVTLASGSLFSALSTEDLDDADLSDALDKLTDAMTQLTDGSSALYEGLCTLLEKSGELTDGISQLGDGAKALKDGTDTLKAGTNELYAGTAELADGLGTLSENSASLNNGAAQVFNTLLSTATAQIREAGISVPNLTIGNYASVLTEVIASLDKDAVYQQALETVTAAVEAQRPAIETAVTAAVREKVEAQVTAAVQAEVQSGVTAAVQEQVAGQVILTATGMDRESYEAAVENGLVDAETQAAVEAAIQAQLASDSVQNQIETLTSTKMASDEIQSTISKTTDAQMQSADVQASIQQNVELQVTKAISDAMASDEVQAQLAAASEGAKSIIALKTSLDSYNTFYLGLLTYTEGVDTAAEGAYELLAGTRELQDGAVQLQEGAAELYNGVLTLQESVPALTDGVTQLRDGAKELADGLEQFREEVVQKLLDAADGDLSELTDRLEAIVETARGYRNFSGIADGMDGQVKFVYRTDEIKAD